MPATPSTKYRVASVSKPFTTACLMRLVEAGVLELDTPVRDVLPDFPHNACVSSRVAVRRDAPTAFSRFVYAFFCSLCVGVVFPGATLRLCDSAPAPMCDRASPDPLFCSVDGRLSAVTVRHLASHLSGIRHYVGDEFHSTMQFDDVADALRIPLSNNPFVAAPGTSFVYSTHAFTALSAVMQAAANEPFLDLMHAMFQEAGMRDTRSDCHNHIIANRARPYVAAKPFGTDNAPFVNLSSKCE